MNSSLPMRFGGGGGGGHRRNTEGSIDYYGSYAHAPPSLTEAISRPKRVPQSKTDRLIVGVDFGTTYSSVAAVYLGTSQPIDMICSWPGGTGIASETVPTEIAYVTGEGAGPGAAPTIKWAFQCQLEDAPLRCFKLSLDWSHKMPSYVNSWEMAQQLALHGKNVDDVVSDYLTQLHRHTMETLTRRYGDSFMKSTRVDFILTCPAVWSDDAKNKTLQAVEPAAAFYTLRDLQPNFLKVGNNFIVCDAGGGTVDLIAYKITSLQPLCVHESTVGTGDLCGSAFLNYRFEDHVKTRVGEARFENLKAERSKAWELALKEFEVYVKRNFKEDQRQEVNIPLPGQPDDPEAGIEVGYLRMTADQIKHIFEPVVKQVCELVQGHVDGIRAEAGIVSGIVLGGFGQNPYLYHLLKQTFGSAPPPPYSKEPPAAVQEHGPIEVLQSPQAWTAVARGAVLRGLEDSMVLSRKAKKHYGTSYEAPYNPTVHSIHERIWSTMHERYMVPSRMSWHIRKGETLFPNVPVAFEYARTFPRRQGPRIVQDKLIACEADDPPASLTDACEHVCTLKINLNAVPRGLFRREINARSVECERLDFYFEMVVDSAVLAFSSPSTAPPTAAS